MASKEKCAKYQYVLTPSGPQILPVPDEESKDEESAADYNAGGYLPIKINDNFKDKRYTVVRKLGWGHFSTVWLVKDVEHKQHSALKVIKSANRYAETARDEIKLLSQVAAVSPLHPGRRHIVSFLDSFDHSGPHGIHVCIVFEPLGENLLALIERNKKKGVPQPLVKVIAKQVLLGLQYLHDECDLVHTDIKPENILISIPDIEDHISEELSISSSPTSRRVGVPLPAKSRYGIANLTQQRGLLGRERQVQIFDSQPLSSPSSRSRSKSASTSGHHLSMKMSSMSLGLAQYFPNHPPSGDTLQPPSSPSTSSATSSFSNLFPIGSGSSISTPLTSFGEPDSAILAKMPSKCSPKAEGVKSQKLAEPQPCSPISFISHDLSSAIGATGPSLLTQTAPRDNRSPSPPSRDTSSSSASVSSSTPTPDSLTTYEPITIKIADLGNATPSKRHFTEDIQTRQYRAPEAILGRRDWGTRADIWSVACVVFELLTAEYLFDPHGRGELFTKDDDHMAQIIELMGDFPPDAKMGGKYSRELFDHAGSLRYIKTLKPWPLARVMIEKYLFSPTDAAMLCAFLEPMLAPDQRERKEAKDMAGHAWLTVKDEEWVGLEEW